MKKLYTGIYLLVLVLLVTGNLLAQASGDYRSLASGNWSAAATWEVYDGTVWAPAIAAPAGTENITIDDSVAADAALTVTGYIKVEGIGRLEVTVGSVTFGNGSTYEHARNGGTLPTAAWDSVSTCLITGVAGNAPGNANQDFYNFTWNCAAQSANLNLAWSGNTIKGNLTCLSSASSRFQMSNNTAILAPITINGDVIVSGGTLTATGSSGAATYDIYINGNVIVTAGNLSLSRGSGGLVNMYLLGDFSVSNATIQTSNNSSKFIFTATDTQQVALSSVVYTGRINYDIDTSATINIVDGVDTVDMAVNGTMANLGGAVLTAGVLSFENNSIYRHARDGGNIPTAKWRTGSTCEITGITATNPGNGNQDFYNLIWNCAAQSGNRSMNWNGNTISGNITILNTSSARWQLCAPATDSTVTTTILGDIIQSAGNFSSQGTSNANSTVIINVYGDIHVTGGNFSVARGSQNTTGTTTWNLYGDTISIVNASTQNSNSTGAYFRFVKDGRQVLNLENITFSGGFPVMVMSPSILNIGTSIVRGSGYFRVYPGATLEISNAGGLDSAIQTSGTKIFAPEASYGFTGTEAQVTGVNLPSPVKALTINNAAGVSLSADLTVKESLSIVNGDLDLNGKTVTLDTIAVLSETAGNTVKGTTGKLTAIRNLNAPTALNVAGLGAVITATADLGNTLVERYHAAPTGQGNHGILRYYNIEPAQNNSGLNATLRISYDESELNGITEGSLGIFRSETGLDNSWTLEGGTLNSTDNYIELTGVGGFSYWSAGDIGVSLPVELTSFTAAAGKNKVSLNWVTATEINNLGWDIERKSDKTSWTKIGFVPGGGNRTEQASYKFDDDKIISGNILYRLKQNDYDGTFEYSKVVEVEVSSLPKEFALRQNYPNPFNPSTTVKFEIPSASHVNLSVYSIIGEKVAELVNEQMEPGVYTKTFNGSSLSSGMYIYKLSAGNNSITMKMIMIK